MKNVEVHGVADDVITTNFTSFLHNIFLLYNILPTRWYRPFIMFGGKSQIWGGVGVQSAEVFSRYFLASFASVRILGHFLRSPDGVFLDCGAILLCRDDGALIT